MQAKPDLPLLRMATLPQLTQRARTFFILASPLLLDMTSNYTQYTIFGQIVCFLSSDRWFLSFFHRNYSTS